MIGVAVTFEDAAWQASLQELGLALDDELNAALARGAEAIVYAAKAEHSYTDQTGRLTRSTRAYAPQGRLSRGDLRVEIVAREDYASHVVRRRTDWLMDAYQRNAGRVEHEVELALDAAVRRTGLGP